MALFRRPSPVLAIIKRAALQALARSLPLVGGVLLLTGGRALAVAPNPVYECADAPRFKSELDQRVVGTLNTLGLEPVLCSDAVFVRRAYIDLIGTLPTAGEARAFIEDPDRAHKRQALVDKLLERPEFTDYWSMRWGDVLRIKAEFPINLWPNAAQAYHHWVHEAIAHNMPYDQFVRTLLTSSGSNFRVGPVNFYRAMQNRTPEGIAAAVALTFMGVRLEMLPAEQRAGMAQCFSQIGYKPTNEWKEEHVFWDPLGSSTAPGAVAPGVASVLTPKGQLVPREPNVLPKSLPNGAAVKALLPDGTQLVLPPDRDPREVFADWLIRPDNPWFARSIVNRTWFWLLGRGIVQEPDDFRPDNPPSNPALLDFLAEQFVASHYDFKQLCRLIATSTTYQLSSVPRYDPTVAEPNFATYPLRRMDAEVMIDAINKITGTTSLYTSAIPEPFTYIPEDQPAIALADGSITSPFLALFGRSARATGMESERVNKPVTAQALHLLNSTHIQRKLEQGPALRKLYNTSKKGRDLMDQLYLTILSRFPTDQEVATFLAYGKQPAAHARAAKTGASATPAKGKYAGKYGKRGAAAKAAAPNPFALKSMTDWLDLSWALVNSNEFLFRH